VFLWGGVSRMADELQQAGVPPMQAMLESADTVLRSQQRHISIPKRFGIPMKDVMAMQLRFRHQHGRRALRTVEHPSFRAAYDFLLLRVAAGDEPAETAEFWTRLQDMDSEHRRSAVQPKRGRSRKRQRPQRRKRPVG